MISQANRRPGHATWLSDIRSKPFAPVFTCQKNSLAQRESLFPNYIDILLYITSNYNKSFHMVKAAACSCELARTVYQSVFVQKTRAVFVSDNVPANQQNFFIIEAVCIEISIK